MVLIERQRCLYMATFPPFHNQLQITFWEALHHGITQVIGITLRVPL